jgi:hypothetical protein
MTPAREHMRTIFGNSSRLWSGLLTEEQRNRWCAAGPKVMSHPRLGQRGPLTGQQFWQSINSVRGCVGLALTLEPPEPVTFGQSPVGPLTTTNDENGVRLWVAVTGELNEDIMVFAQAPCPSGRFKRRNVAYLGLLPPPIGGLSEITQLYTARYGEPRPGRKVFIVTCQQKDGWKAIERETSAIVPNPPEPNPAAAEANATTFSLPAAAAAQGLPATAEPSPSQFPYMHKGGTWAAQGIGWPPGGSPQATGKPSEGDKPAPVAGSEGGAGESAPPCRPG